MDMNILSPSILAADFSKLGEEINLVTKSGAEWIHLDVMDGDFVPNISFGMPVISSVRKITDAFLDVHLMIREPIRYIDDFVKAGADMITVHYEACNDVFETIKKIHAFGVKAGLAVSPDTDLSVIKPHILDVDMILIMSVYPGFGGQVFIENAYDRLREVRRMADDLENQDIRIEIDGGVVLDNVKAVCDAGADVIVAGSAVFKNDRAQNVNDFLNIIRGDDR